MELMYQYTDVKFQQSMCIIHIILYRYGFPCAVYYFGCNSFHRLFKKKYYFVFSYYFLIDVKMLSLCFFYDFSHVML